MSDPRTTFRAELTRLRDQIVAAIEGRRTGAVEAGLALYEDMVADVLDAFRGYSRQVQPGRWRRFNHYGDEMRWLEEDQRLFIDRAVASRSRDVLRLVRDHVYSLMHIAFERRELEQFRAALDLHGVLYEATSITVEPGLVGLRTTVLQGVEDFARYYVARDLQTDDSLRPFVEAVANFLANVAHREIAARAVSDFRRVLANLNGALEEPLRSDEVTNEWMASVRNEANLGLLAYVLLIVATDGSSADLSEIAAVVRGRIGQMSLAQLERALDSGAHRFQWHWWETSRWEERTGGVLQFDHYLVLAFASLVLEGRAYVDRLDVEGESGRRYTLTRLREAVEELAQGEPWTWLNLGQQQESVLSSISAAIHAHEVSEDAILIAASLDPTRVNSFLTAVTTAWSEAGELRQLVAERRGDPQKPPEMMLGLSNYTPKEFFTETNVYADPASLGRDVGRSLTRGEDIQIRSALSALPTIHTSLDDVRSKVLDCLRRARGRFSPSVVVFNDWRLFDAIIEERDYSTAGRGLVGDASARLAYTEGAGGCVVADFERALELRWWPMEQKLPSDRLVYDGRLLVGVSQLEQEEAAKAVARNPQLYRTPEDAQYPAEEAVRRVLKTVVVRAYERFEVVLSDASAGWQVTIDVDTDGVLA